MRSDAGVRAGGSMHQEQYPQPKVARHSLSETVIAPRRFKLGGFSLLLNILALCGILLPGQTLALDCSNPPPAWQSDWPKYEQWCSACGGSADVHTGTCTPGANWGRSGSTGSQQPSSDFGNRQWEEQQQRERERKRREFNEAERRAREQEEARRKQFEQGKQKALNLLKSGSNDLSLKETASGGTGLKGTQPSELQLKEPLFSRGTRNSAPPDLSGLDPKWPIVVDPKQVQGRTPQALRQANLTTHVLLDALEEGHGDWRESIRFLQNKLKDKPGDANLTDALNLVRGYYNGYLGAKEVSDNYYRYGVRQWLEGDFDSAARAFARAYRENPDDTLLFRSFARTLGLRDASGHCDAFACSHIDIPRWSLVDELHIRETMESNLEEARLAVSVDPADLELRASLNYLEGLVGYQDWLESEPDKTQKPFDKQTMELTNAGLKRLAERDYAGAFQAFAKASEGREDDRGILFAMSYARGLAAAQRHDADRVPDALWDRRIEQVYEARARQIDEALADQLFAPCVASPVQLTRQIKDTPKRNPFFGRLSSKEVDSLKQWAVSLFR